MSATFVEAAKALSANPDLLAKVKSAGSTEERQAHLKDAGVVIPTHADVNSHVADMAGGSGTWSSPGPGTVVPAAAAAAAAA
jgi:hypothetical protein